MGEKELKMRKMMIVGMILLVVGLVFALVGEAFARDRFGRGRGCRGRSFDRGPNYSDQLRWGAQQAIGVGVDLAITAAVNAIAGGGGCSGSVGVGYGGATAYDEGVAQGIANIEQRRLRREISINNNLDRADRARGMRDAERLYRR